ncbi:MAG: hypothetical protein ABIG39_02195 [Candidatus Micrarchaeota archaeon]
MKHAKKTRSRSKKKKNRPNFFLRMFGFGRTDGKKELMRTATSITRTDYREQRITELDKQREALERLSERVGQLKSKLDTQGLIRIAPGDIPAVPKDLTGDGPKHFHEQATMLVSKDSTLAINVKRLTEVLGMMKGLCKEMAETEGRIKSSMSIGSESLPFGPKEQIYHGVFDGSFKRIGLLAMEEELREIKSSLQKVLSLVDHFQYAAVQKAADTLFRTGRYVDVSKDRSKQVVSTGTGHMEKISKHLTKLVLAVDDLFGRINTLVKGQTEFDSFSSKLELYTRSVNSFISYNEMRIDRPRETPVA